MTQLIPETIRQFVERAATANMDAMNTQTSYLEALVKRNARVFASMTGASVNSLKEMTSKKTFSEGFDAGLAFEETLRDEMEQLHEDNLQAWEALERSLKSIYAPFIDRETVKAPKKATTKKAA
jgi:hypothetical protein